MGEVLGSGSDAVASVAVRAAVDVRPAPTLPSIDTEERTTPSTGDGDHDRFTHYVARRELERYRRTGRPVTALCGKRWRPDGDPSRYPMCGTCSEIAAERLVGDLGS